MQYITNEFCIEEQVLVSFFLMLFSNETTKTLELTILDIFITIV